MISTKALTLKMQQKTTFTIVFFILGEIRLGIIPKQMSVIGAMS